MSGENGILEVETLCQHTSLAQTSPRREAGVARATQSAGRAVPWVLPGLRLRVKLAGYPLVYILWLALMLFSGGI